MSMWISTPIGDKFNELYYCSEGLDLISLRTSVLAGGQIDPANVRAARLHRLFFSVQMRSSGPDDEHSDIIVSISSFPCEIPSWFQFDHEKLEPASTLSKRNDINTNTTPFPTSNAD
jgi:hypothetical protein